MEQIRAFLNIFAAPAYHFAWDCPGPPRWTDPRGEPWDPSEVVRYIKDNEDQIDFEEFAAAVGGESKILEAIGQVEEWERWGGSIGDDWSVSWDVSQYPDETKVYVMTHSGIEYVFEPAGYVPPDTFSAPGYTSEDE